MSDQITEAFVRQFSDNISIGFQQEGSALRGATQERSCNGEKDWWPIVGSAEAVPKTVRHGPTPRVDTPHHQRLALMTNWIWADLIDKQDNIRVLLDPQSEYAKNGKAAMKRAFDDTVISAFDAAVRQGEGGSSTATFTSEAAGDHDFSSAAFSIPDLLAIKTSLDEQDVPTEGRHIALPPAGLYQLLKQTSSGNVTSEEFADIKALVNGEIDFFLGFTFHPTTLLPKPAANVRYGFAWHEDALGVSIAKDITVEIMEREDLDYSTQVLVEGNFGAVRIQGGGVVRFLISEEL